MSARPVRLAPASLILAALVAAFVVPGCGSGGPEMAGVSGKVTYKGQPVTTGTISFVATDPNGRNATGNITADGTYSLQTENPGDGALVGAYNVAINTSENAILDYIPKKPVPPKRQTPAKFESPQGSGLKATVKSGSNTIDFDLVD